MKDLPGLRVAIVHDWLIGGGAERVVLELHQMFPDAPIYTSYCSDEWRQKLDNKVITGWLQSWPFSRLRKYIPFLRIWWFTHLDFDDFDLVLSSSGAEAKGIKAPKRTIHINYCHAPTHYYWSRYDEYIKQPGFGVFDPLARLGLKLLVGPLRRWDYKAAQRPDIMVANSNYIKAQVKKYYGRETAVVHPPVDVERFSSHSNKLRKGFVVVGRQTPYKKIDFAVAACTNLSYSLTVVGDGPDHQKLQTIAGPTITFVTNPSDQKIVEFVAGAEAFIFPGLDDFGLSAVEAMAAGTPVIAYKDGGALDYVVEGKTGTFFSPQTVDALEKRLQEFNPKQFSSAEIQKSAQGFNQSAFDKNMREVIDQALALI